MYKKVLFAALVISCVFTAGVYIYFKERPEAKNGQTVSISSNVPENDPEISDKESNEKKEEPAEDVKKDISFPSSREKVADKVKSVPFTSQAPSGNWNESVFQDGCEEASVAMAMAWVNEKSFTKESAEKEIRELAKFEDKIFAHHINTSVQDTARLVKEFYLYKNIDVLENVTIVQIKAELANGNVVLLPAYGRALRNPFYTQPGPVEHMLVVTGYDASSNEFITNDPGTKRGEGYRYDENVLFDAVWTYPTGSSHSDPPVGSRKKTAIVVGQKK